MPYTAVRRYISRELSDDIDEWDKELRKRGVELSKEEVSVIMSVALQHNGGPKQINVIVKEAKYPHKKHRIEQDLMDMDIKDLLDKEVKVVIE